MAGLQREQSAICLVGPTAAGKTELAVELVQRRPLEIVSVDSAQVYRGMDIGTGKPDARLRQLAPHRLIDIRDPAESYSAAQFRVDALAAIREIFAAGRTPLLVGGTMLYFRALWQGLAPLPGADAGLRRQLAEDAARNGWQAIHRRLADVDPRAAARIHPNDPQRLQRALEVYLLTGRTISSFHDERKSGAGRSTGFRLHFLEIDPGDRAALHRRIESRFRQMLADGLVEEVRGLHGRSDLHGGLPSMKSVGYRQVWQYLDGALGYSEMVEKSIAATRQLAKRQLTWLRGWPGLQRLDDEDRSKDCGEDRGNRGKDCRKDCRKDCKNSLDAALKFIDSLAICR